MVGWGDRLSHNQWVRFSVVVSVCLEALDRNVFVKTKHPHRIPLFSLKIGVWVFIRHHVRGCFFQKCLQQNGEKACLLEPKVQPKALVFLRPTPTFCFLLVFFVKARKKTNKQTKRLTHTPPTKNKRLSPLFSFLGHKQKLR